MSRCLQRIIKFPPTRSLQVDEKQLVWKFRFSLMSEKKALTKFVRAVDWSDIQVSKSIHTSYCRFCIVLPYFLLGSVDWRMSLCMPVCSSLLWLVGTVRNMACLTKIESSQGMGVQMRVYGELVLSFFFFFFGFHLAWLVR